MHGLEARGHERDEDKTSAPRLERLGLGSAETLPASSRVLPEWHTQMGRRCHRLFPERFLGLGFGDAEIIRNGGGRVTEDVIRWAAAAQRCTLGCSVVRPAYPAFIHQTASAMLLPMQVPHRLPGRAVLQPGLRHSPHRSAPRLLALAGVLRLC